MPNESADDWLESLFKKLENEQDQQTVTHLARFWDQGMGLNRDNYHYPALSAEQIQKLEAWKADIALWDTDNASESSDTDATRHSKLNIAYSSDLNKAQWKAVNQGIGPIMVLAGAGTGKTRVLIYRAAWWIDRGVNPDNIALLTFTRKAAREMIQRASALTGNNLMAGVWAGTFHAFANMLLRKYSNLIDLPASFSIMDQEDAADAIDLVKAGTYRPADKRMLPGKYRILEVISAARNREMTIAEVIEKDFTGLAARITYIENIERNYTRYKRLSNLLDYDDLLETLLLLLQKHQRFRDLLRARYPYILVDEFQDTNLIQHRILEQLAAPSGNITVVGDDMLSIYGFRGARVENMLLFRSSFPGARLIRLEENYRSHQGILAFTNALAAAALMQLPKHLYSAQGVVNRPVFSRLYSDEEEAVLIADQIIALRDRGLQLTDMAVLYRSTWHSNKVQAELLSRQIPYVVYGGLKFNERRHVKDLLAGVKVILNHRDTLSWHRMLKLFAGVGEKTAHMIYSKLERQNGSLKLTGNHLGKKYSDELHRLIDALQYCISRQNAVSDVVAHLIAWYSPHLRAMADNYPARIDDLHVILKLAERYKSLESFVSDLALEPPSARFQDQTTPHTDESEEAPVVLSTVHSAKGLEWHTVFVIHLIDGLFPSALSLRNARELEEERRLFYVACTRARHTLHLSMPSQSYYQKQFLSYPSRFVGEAGSQHLDLKL